MRVVRTAAHNCHRIVHFQILIDESLHKSGCHAPASSTIFRPVGLMYVVAQPHVKLAVARYGFVGVLVIIDAACLQSPHCCNGHLYSLSVDPPIPAE